MQLGISDAVRVGAPAPHSFNAAALPPQQFWMVSPDGQAAAGETCYVRPPALGLAAGRMDSGGFPFGQTMVQPQQAAVAAAAAAAAAAHTGYGSVDPLGGAGRPAGAVLGGFTPQSGTPAGTPQDVSLSGQLVRPQASLLQPQSSWGSAAGSTGGADLSNLAATLGATGSTFGIATAGDIRFVKHGDGADPGQATPPQPVTHAHVGGVALDLSRGGSNVSAQSYHSYNTSGELQVGGLQLASGRTWGGQRMEAPGAVGSGNTNSAMPAGAWGRKGGGKGPRQDAPNARRNHRGSGGSGDTAGVGQVQWVAGYDNAKPQARGGRQGQPAQGQGRGAQAVMIVGKSAAGEKSLQNPPPLDDSSSSGGVGVAAGFAGAPAVDASDAPLEGGAPTKKRRRYRRRRLDQQRFKTVLCRNFRKAGCQFGDDCAFAHDEAEIRHQEPASPQSPLNVPQHERRATLHAEAMSHIVCNPVLFSKGPAACRTGAEQT